MAATRFFGTLGVLLMTKWLDFNKEKLLRPQKISSCFIGKTPATNDVFQRVGAVSQCFVRARRNKSIDNNYQCGSSVFFHLLLLLGEDIEVNPGQWKFPGGICSKPVKSNQMGIKCDECE